LFFVDAIQQLGALPLDAEACHIDFLAADAHKWLLGPEGIAVFYCRASARPRLRLIQQGWHMFDNPWNFHRNDWEPSPNAKRFEAGSPNSMGQTALHSSLDLLLKTGMKNVSSRILQNTGYLIEALPSIPGIVITSPTQVEQRSGIVCFAHSDIPSKTLNKRLAKAGATCAVRGTSIRVSPHFYQDETELTRFIRILEASI
jgi:cysteine desulfurase/selenocysteine lyase